MLPPWKIKTQTTEYQGYLLSFVHIHKHLMYTAKIIKHRGQKRIAVVFEKKQELIERFKKLDGAQWSNTRKVWHLPDTDKYRQQFKLPPKQQLSGEAQQQIEKYTK